MTSLTEPAATATTAAAGAFTQRLNLYQSEPIKFDFAPIKTDLAEYIKFRGESEDI
jgi:hypothetical protein